MSKLFLTLICGPGSYEDVHELWEPIRDHFDGLCAVCHDAPSSPLAWYLEETKKAGRIIYLPYVGRHDMSRNVALHCGVIEDGDWVMQCDTLERIQPKVLTELVPLLTQLRGGVDMYLYYGKPLLFAYHESLSYQGTPHEGLRRLDGCMRAEELSQAFPDEREIRLNVRPIKRDKWHWVSHYARYMLLPWGSNHGLLGLSDRGDPATLFPAREQARLRFRDEMLQRGFPRTIDGLNAMLKQPLDDKLKSLINSDKVWVDYYRFHVLGERDLVDEHRWTTKRDIP